MTFPLLPPIFAFLPCCSHLPPISLIVQDMLAVMSATSPQCLPSSSSAHKRPRGLWKGRREATPARDPKAALMSHDIDSDLEDDSNKAHGSVYDDDLDDNRSSTSSSSKRRRITGAFSDIGSPWPSTGRITRSLTPELYHAPSPPHLITNMLKTTPPTSSSDPKGKQASPSDYEDWENLKELFAKAAELCECTSSSIYIPCSTPIAINSVVC